MHEQAEKWLIIRIMKKLATPVLIALALSLMAAVSSCGNAKDRIYAVREAYRVTAPAGVKTFVEIDLPLSYGCQEISGLLVQGAEAFSTTEQDGYRILHAEVAGDGGEHTLSVAYTVTLSSSRAGWDNEVKEAYTAPSQFIDSDHPGIAAATKPLLAESDDETARNIFDFVVKSLSAKGGYEGTTVASAVLERGHGVCEDYSNLMVALLRAANIPARAISGLTLNKLSTSDSAWEHAASSGSHAWVEYYTEGKWHFADPTWGDGLAGSRYFGHSDGYHLSYGEEPMIADTAYITRFNQLESEGYFIPISITAPFKVTAWSQDKGVEVTPMVSIVKR
jgi:hypothetical protein